MGFGFFGQFNSLNRNIFCSIRSKILSSSQPNSNNLPFMISYYTCCKSFSILNAASHLYLSQPFGGACQIPEDFGLTVLCFFLISVFQYLPAYRLTALLREFQSSVYSPTLVWFLYIQMRSIVTTIKFSISTFSSSPIGKLFLGLRSSSIYCWIDQSLKLSIRICHFEFHHRLIIKGHLMNRCLLSSTTSSDLQIKQHWSSTLKILPNLSFVGIILDSNF